MVQRKVVVLIATAVTLFIAAGVICAVIFTLPSNPSNDDAEPTTPLPEEVPAVAAKRTAVSGNTIPNKWYIQLREDANIEQVKGKLADANMPWEVTSSDDNLKSITMNCGEDILPMALNMLVGAADYIEQEAIFNSTETTSLWGLDRIDQLLVTGDRQYNPPNSGAGVDVHILDTGSQGTHSEFGGRVAAGYDAIQDGRAANTDCQGHGTHVAGTIGGRTYGVAKSVNMVSSRVLGCTGSGSTSGIVNAIKWVTALQKTRPAVISMSLGGPASTATDNAVAAAVAAGVTVVVAAGNENQDACNVSPARAPSAITVGASDIRDARASFSNYGSCVDIFGPGVNILSAAPTSNTASATMSGTSMATPHVAGVAALVLAANPRWTPAEVTNFLVGQGGNPGRITDTKASPNVLLYTGQIGTQTPTRAPTTVATSAPPATSAAPTPGSETVTGNLQSRSVDYQPKPDQKYSVTSRGVHRATLTGPSGTDFDLYLLRYSPTSGSWVAVAQGTSASSNEVVAYTDSDSVGTQWFSWQVYSYRGSGTYTLTFSHP